MCKTEFRDGDEVGSSQERVDSAHLNGSAQGNSQFNTNKDKGEGEDKGEELEVNSQKEIKIHGSMVDVNCHHNKRPSILANFLSTSCNPTSQSTGTEQSVSPDDGVAQPDNTTPLIQQLNNYQTVPSECSKLVHNPNAFGPKSESLLPLEDAETAQTNLKAPSELNKT